MSLVLDPSRGEPVDIRALVEQASQNKCWECRKAYPDALGNNQEYVR